MVYSIHDPAELAIEKMVEGTQPMIGRSSQGGELGGMSPPIKKHLELEIETLENVPRDADKLERLLQVKLRQKEEAMHMEDTQRLVTEIEMLGLYGIVFGLQKATVAGSLLCKIARLIRC